MVNSKHAFWQALISASLIFGLGLLLGTFFEQSRSNEIETLLLNSEISILDSQLTGIVTDNLNIECNIARDRLFQFADEIFMEAELLEKYDESSQLSSFLNTIHKKYDLLRLILWSESIKQKNKCKFNYNTVVYLYQYDNPSIPIKSQQIVFARYLTNMKELHGTELLLIPIAADLNLTSIDLVKTNYNIKKLPAIIINEDITINSIEELENLDTEIFNSNNIERIVLIPNNNQ
jgi:hypothetical protein